MKILWIYPIQKKCGISIYSERYLKELSTLIDVDTLECDSITLCSKEVLNKINQYDILHIQYETSLYLKKRTDLFSRLVKNISIPIIISLHEIYNDFPGVYPKRLISGLLSPIKNLIYDYRHPIVTAYNKHLKKSFFADTILVHYNYQQEILLKQISDKEKIKVQTYPTEAKEKIIISNKSVETLSLISTGFINKNYNYEFLISTLDKLTMPWKFSWLGGPRTPDDIQIINNLNKIISEKNWNKIFKITNWLSNEKMEEEINKADIALHLYKDRSSSDTLCKSISYGIPIIATKLPLTEELQKDTEIILTSQNNSSECAEMIEKLYHDIQWQIKLSEKEYSYAKNHSYALMSKRLVKIYGDLL